MLVALLTYLLDSKIQMGTTETLIVIFQDILSILKGWSSLREYFFALKSNLLNLFFRDYSLL